MTEYKELGLTLTRWRYVLFTLSVILVSAVIINPFPIIGKVDPKVESYFNAVNALTSGDIMLVDPATNMVPFQLENPGIIAHATFIAKKHIPFVMIAFTVGGPTMIARFVTNIKPILDAAGYVYGVDYVNLGYIPGGEPGVAAFCRDIWALTPTDTYGTPISDIPLMKRVRTASDFKLFWYMGSGIYESLGYIRQIIDPYKLPAVFLGGAGMDVPWSPYYPYSVVGMAVGTRGMAELEVVFKVTGTGIARLTGVHMINFVVTLAVVLGNAIMVYTKMKERKEPLIRRRK